MLPNGSLVEGFWKNEELIGEFIMIKPNGDSFIGRKKDGRLHGYVYKFEKLCKVLVEGDTTNQTWGKEALNYTDEQKLSGFGMERDVKSKSVYFGHFNGSKVTR